MSSVTNGNDYKRGWEEGHQDALDGKNKDFRRMGMSWKFVFHGNIALDSYTDGYNKGYEAGINEKNVVRKVEITNNTNNDMDYNSSKAQQFTREIQALKNLNDFLVVDCCDRIRQVDGLFRGYMSVMVNTGVPAEECKAFADKYYVVDKQNFKEIFDRIIRFDLPQIKKYIEQIRKQFQIATGTDIGHINLKVPSNSVSSSLPRNAILSSNGTQDLALQIQAICNMMDFLVDQRNALQQTLYEYQRYCNDMINKGVPKQVVDHYILNYAHTNVGIINRLSGHIQNEDYTQLKNLYVQISESLAELGSSANRLPKAM